MVSRGRELSLFVVLFQVSFVLAQEGQFVPVEAGTSASLRGLWIASDDVMWVSGAKGTVLRSADGGRTFKSCSPIGHDSTDFRDVHATDDTTAVIMAAGVPPVLLRTEDGGQTWDEVFRHPNPTAFFDAMTIRDDGVGLVIGDPIEGRWVLLVTSDHGKTWTALPEEKCPLARGGEHAFAASGSLIAFEDSGRCWISLGGDGSEASPPRARVLIGESVEGPWTSVASPLTGGNSAGIFSIAIGEGGRVGIVGGDYQDEAVAPAASLVLDVASTWQVPEKSVGGYRSSLAIQKQTDGEIWFACGPTGIDRSADRGESWERFSETGYHVLGFSKSGLAGLAIGSEGRIARWQAAGSATEQ